MKKACSCADELPIRVGQLVPEMFDSTGMFIDRVLSSGRNPFSIRFRTYAYNSCIDPATPAAKRQTKKLHREVLTHAEAMSLTYYKSYLGKLTLLSRTK